MRKNLWIIALVGTLALAACGGGGGGGSSVAANCKPSGTTITVLAQGLEFDKTCYAAPADTPFKVNLDNKDSALHTFSIYTDSSATKALFVSPSIGVGTKTFSVKAIAAGTYYFQCDVHKNMNGAFVVK
jgi:plastocyanin